MNGGLTKRVQAGFTVVELMIATLVFSSVMILITVGVLSFTKSYYKGINQSNTQNAARTITENITQAIQFSGGGVTAPAPESAGGTPKSKAVCIGDLRYSYLPGWQVFDGTLDSAMNRNRNGLVVDKPGSCLAAQNLQAATLAAGSMELLPPLMRISKLEITQLPDTTNTWKVVVRIVYGDNDLLETPAGPNARCRVSISGSQYCAQSELTTFVKKRVN